MISPHPFRNILEECMKHPLIAAGILALANGASAQDRPILTVLTYDSFVPDWGAGPLVALEILHERLPHRALLFVHGAGELVRHRVPQRVGHLRRMQCLRQGLPRAARGDLMGGG